MDTAPPSGSDHGPAPLPVRVPAQGRATAYLEVDPELLARIATALRSLHFAAPGTLVVPARAEGPCSNYTPPEGQDYGPCQTCGYMRASHA